MTSDLSSTSYARNFSESGCGCGSGDGVGNCSGYQFGSTYGTYQSMNLDLNGPFIEYGVTFTGSTFTMVDSPLVSNQPCCPPPTIS